MLPTATAMTSVDSFANNSVAPSTPIKDDPGVAGTAGAHPDSETKLHKRTYQACVSAPTRLAIM